MQCMAPAGWEWATIIDLILILMIHVYNCKEFCGETAIIWLWPGHWSPPPKFGHKYRMKISIFLFTSLMFEYRLGGLVVPGECWWLHTYIFPGPNVLSGVPYHFYCSAKKDRGNQSNLPLLEVSSGSELYLLTNYFVALILNTMN